MTDYILRALARDAGLRVILCNTTELALEGARRHATAPLASAALGFGLTAGTLLGATLKVGQRVALKFDGDGPLGKLLVEADAYGRVRGYVAQPEAGGLDPLNGAPLDGAVAAGIGSGILTVSKDLKLRDLYQGTIALTGRGPQDDIAQYLARSEQIPALLRLDVQMQEAAVITAAGGLHVELMPGHQRDELDRLATRLKQAPPVGQRLLAGESLEDIAAWLLDGIDYTVLETRPVAFVCSCSYERSRKALSYLSPDDILEMIIEGEAVVDCHFCHERYVFSARELAEILDEMEAGT